MNTFDRLFIARTFLSLSQKEAAEQAGINAASVSIMERGEKKFIPTEYLQLLYAKGIDINWIFSDSNDTSLVFRKPVQSARLNGADTPEPAEGSLHQALSSQRKNSYVSGALVTRYMQDFNSDLKDILQELRKMNASLCPTYPG
jgi:transcriptional regulator with XRE-family HTH domain